MGIPTSAFDLVIGTLPTRDELRRVLIRYLDDRDAIAFRLMRYRDEAGNYGRTRSAPKDVAGWGHVLMTTV
jgi:hypothetical protein